MHNTSVQARSNSSKLQVYVAVAPGGHDAIMHAFAPANDALQHIISFNVIIVIIAIVFITKINNIVFKPTHIFITGTQNTNVSAAITAAPLLAAAPITTTTTAAAADKRSSRARRQRRAKTTCAGQTLQTPKPPRPRR
jgi:hypothetical protein